MNSDIKAIIEWLEQRSEPQPLLPEKTWNASLEGKIEALNNLGSSIEMITLIAALHLRNDSLDLSHSYAQKIEHDATGAYWHGIMHRMEGDFSNAKYWFWQAGQHPAMQQAKQRIAEWLQQHWSGQTDGSRASSILQSFQNGGWSSEQFVELIKESSTFAEDMQQLLLTIQALEIEALFQHTLATYSKH